MKSLFVLTICCLAHTIIIAQEPTADMQTAWRQLVSDLNRRHDLVTNLVPAFKNAGYTDTASLKKTLTLSRQLYVYLDTLQYGTKAGVAAAESKWKALDKALRSVLWASVSQRKVNANESVRDLTMQLEGTENRIKVATNNYNIVCKRDRHPALQIGLDTPKAPDVKF